MIPLVLGFDSAAADLDACGGKGVNLARLTRAGFDVPPGFILTTAAYRGFVAANGLDRIIRQALEHVDRFDRAAVEDAVLTIRGAFNRATVPERVQDELLQAWQALDGVPVAVRSSATAEDLGDHSFAGQQDTFLNIVGFLPLLRAVVDCWVSLWTPRAISYRAGTGIRDTEVALAVVVQRLVSPEVSGVLFTANPLSGDRGQSVIDATFGLGEPLVSGQVVPDHIVVESSTGRIVEQAVGTKTPVSLPRPGGGITSAATDTDAPCLTDEQVRDLVVLGQQVQDEYGSPQDIEWALAEGRFKVLQARPITTLFPQPPGDPTEPSLWLSVAAVQGMVAPITPLGQDAIALVFAGGARLFGGRVDPWHNPYLGEAGGRLWVRIDRLLRHQWGRRLLPRMLAMVEPSVRRLVDDLIDDPALSTVDASLPGLPVRLMGPALGDLPRALMDPAGQRLRFQASAEELVSAAADRERQASRLGESRQRLQARLRGMELSIGSAIERLLPHFLPLMGPSMALVSMLQEHLEPLGPRATSLVLGALRGVPGNVTTEMDLALWRVAQAIRQDGPSAAAFAAEEPAELAQAQLRGRLPRPAQKAIGEFLDRYGMRGPAEIDLGQRRWREDPEPIIRVLLGYIRADDPDLAPDQVFRSGVEAADEATAALSRLVATKPVFPGLPRRAQARQLRRAVAHVRAMIGVRETPKFTIVRVLGLVREGLLASGRDLVAAGYLSEPDDIMFLRFRELDRLWARDPSEFAALAAERRARHVKEQGRRQVPRLLTNTGRAYYEGLPSNGATMGGSPVSPGVVEGKVRVVFDPSAAALQPGEILVCVGTDPSWTPLFLTASGLVTEVGGLMTHGSVVAREYGIPAVVGVDGATSRLHTGQRIRLDGSNGSLTLMPEETRTLPG